MEQLADLVVYVYTGDQKYAGTNNTVHIQLHSNDGKASNAIILDHFLFDDFERGKIDKFPLDAKDLKSFGRTVVLDNLELWKDRTLGLISDDWYVDKVVVENRATNTSFVFPFFRWIKSDRRYRIRHLDTSLPQHDPYKEQRRKDLEEKKQAYQYHQRIPNGPVQVKSLPPDEQFSSNYKSDVSKQTLQLKAKSTLVTLFPDPWTTINDTKLNHENDVFGKPRYVDDWNLDANFARQRLAGLNSGLIRLVKHLPDNFPVTNQLLGPLLEGLTLAQAIEQKKLYMTNLRILEGVPARKGFTVCAPLALFFVNAAHRMVPVAIQLFQQPEGNNPIFTPNDPPLTWTLAKMWHNNAEAQHHQSISHLGLTHYLCEGFAIAMHRNLSPSHPIFKLLAPHFLYLIAVNWEGIATMVTEGGWTDEAMNIGSEGMKSLIIKGFDSWRLDVEGQLPEDMKARGVEDPSLLPGYHYVDDALVIFQAIRKYVHAYVNIYYTGLFSEKSDPFTCVFYGQPETPKNLQEDTEIQAWAQELVKERNGQHGGCGIKGVPGNGTLTACDQLVKILTSIVYTCSVVHAAVNFPQYDEYGFPPNYPAMLKGKPPSSKVEVSERDMMACLPDQEETFNIMLMTNVLSRKAALNLGNFEVQYVVDPKALHVIKRFRQELDKISWTIKDRNSVQDTPYDYLDPAKVPNSICI